MLAVLAPLVLAAGVEDFAVDLAVGERVPVPCEDFARDFLGADAFDAAGGPGEIFVHEMFIQADGLEYLRATVTLDGRDAHLGHRLDDAFDDGFAIVFDGGLVVDVGEQSLADHVIERLEGEVRVDSADAIADQQRKVMNLARLAGFKDEADAGASLFADEMVVQARHGHQRGDGGIVLVHAAVGEDEDVGAVSDGSVSVLAEMFHGGFHPRRAGGGLEENRQRSGLETGEVDMAEFFEILVGEHRAAELDHPAVLRPRIEKVALGADQRVSRGDNLLADGIERRIRDLREELLEITVK